MAKRHHGALNLRAKRRHIRLHRRKEWMSLSMALFVKPFRARGSHTGVSHGIDDHTSSLTSHIVTLLPLVMSPLPTTCLQAPGWMGLLNNSHPLHEVGAVAEVVHAAEV